MITNITIKNIKGFGTNCNSLNVSLNPQKLNLLVAPNGFGKTSITTAFAGLQPRTLQIDENDLHRKLKDLKAELSITIDGITYTANKGKNEINKKIFPFVVRSKVKSSTISKTFSNHTTTKSFLDIEKIKVCDVHPNCTVKYSVAAMRRQFGKNGKILTDISNRFKDYNFTERVVGCYGNFEKFKTKTRQKLVDDILAKIERLKGTEKNVRDAIEADITLFHAIEAEQNYQEALNQLDSEHQLTSLDSFLLFYQLLSLYNSDATNLTDVHKRRTYEAIKAQVNASLQTLNNTWKNINVNETAKELIVSYPQADEISNGQRDILTFVIQLISFRSQIPQNKPSILIIDEIFDYLDDANMIAAQYYLSDMIKKMKQEIYVVILTHVDPNHFRSYVFNKKLNIQMLAKSQPAGSEAMKAFVAFREKLNKKLTDGEMLYNDLSHYFFHYAPETKDVSDKLPAQQNLKITWGRNLTMLQYVIGECNKYLSEQSNYDPYALCIGIRLRLEKMVYDSLGAEEQKKTFLDTHKTNDKMDYARGCGVEIPDSYYFLSAIHNEADHLKDANKDKPCIYKLQHPVVRRIIKTLFDYQGNPISIDYIH